MERRAAIAIGRVMLACCVLIAVSHGKASEPADDGPRPAITITGAWARLNPIAGRPAAVYLTVANNGHAEDRLVTANSTFAEGIEIHRQSTSNGISRMRRLESLDVSVGTQLSLRPGGIHLMLIGPRRDLGDRDSFPLTLDFEVAGEIEIKVLIKNKSAP